MVHIHFLSWVNLLLIGVILLSSTSFGGEEPQTNDDDDVDDYFYEYDEGDSGYDVNFDRNRIDPYGDYVEDARHFNSESMDAASQSITDLAVAIEGQELSPRVLKSLVFEYVKEVTKMGQKSPSQNTTAKMLPSSIAKRRNFTEEEIFCTNLMKLTSELLNVRNQDAWERIRGRGSDDVTGHDSPVNMLEFMDRIINTTVSQVIKHKSRRGGQTAGVFFESDEMIVEFESGRSNYTDDVITEENNNNNVIVISTHYKTISKIINRSVNKSHHHDNTRDCRKWQLSPKLCKMATEARGTEVAPAVKISADSDILSINAFVDGRKRSLPVHMTFRHDPARDDEMVTSPNETVVPLCVFFDTDIHAWSDEGCDGVVGDDDVIVTCKCNHTTTFALLLLVSTPNRFDLDDVDSNCIQTFRVRLQFLGGSIKYVQFKKFTAGTLLKLHG